MSPKRLRSLLIKSAEIQQAIDKEHARPKPDTFRLLKLKKIRFAIKDHILKLMRMRPLKRKKTNRQYSNA